MSAQRYTDPRAHERMAKGLCPECGRLPLDHSDDNRFWMPQNQACNLLHVGVIDRIGQWLEDVKGTR